MVEAVHASDHPLMDAQAIEKQLVELWRAVGTSEKPMVRARVLTLLIVADETRESEMAEQIVQLVERHPTRTILLLVGEPGAEERFDATVTLLCGMNRRALCTEQIHLYAQGRARERLPGAVRTLLTADLPVVLWWTLPPATDPVLLERLARLSDRLLLDSATLGESASLCESASHWAARRASDLNWGRLTSWRDGIAQIFDAPCNRAFLPQLDMVRIEGRQGTHGAHLLAAWLASRLAWQPTGREGERFHFARATGGQVAVALAEGEGEAALQRVLLSGGGATFQVERADETSAECTACLPDEAPLVQRVHLRDERPIALLSRELDRMARDPVFDATLTTLCQMLGGPA